MLLADDAAPQLERYQIVRRLGAGGMGVVYEATDRSSGAAIALKTMRFADPAALYRFKKEFRGLAGLAHPNLAALHELVAEGPQPYFTMELVRGVDFLSFVRGDHGADASALASTQSDPRKDSTATSAATVRVSPVLSTRAHPLDFERLRSALRDLACGVQALHRAGKLHRDLKPSNVLVTRDARVVVLDFGLVVDLDRDGGGATEQGVVSGTVEYMSPEQAAAMELAEPSDWYSFGTMLYEALAERLPFEGGRMTVMLDKQRVDPPAPSTFFADVPGDLDALCIELLRREPRDRPRGHTILERLGVAVEARPAKTTAPATESIPFVGRSSEAQTLRDALARVVSGKPAMVYAHGASGMGKSALVKRTLDELVHTHSERVLVLSGRCYEQESVPFKAIDALIDALSRHLRSISKHDIKELLPVNVHALARLFPVLRRVEAIATAPRRQAENPEPQELRRRAFSALRELLTRMAERHPLVLWIDDLQWGDGDSGMLLGELLRPPDPPSLLFIASYRSEGASENLSLAALRRAEASYGAESWVREIAVTPLSAEEATRLATLLLGPEPGTDAHAPRIAEESAGNPFLVAELVRYVQSGAGVRRSSSGLVRLDEVVEARLSQLDPPVRRLFEIVAVAGKPIARDVAVAAAELDRGEDRSAVAQLRALQLLRTLRAHDVDALDTFHDRLRETGTKLIDPETLVERHRRIAAAMEASRDPDWEALATHTLAIGDRERAGDLAERAGDRSADLLAFERAAAWFQSAIELLVPIRERELALRTKLADALADAGRGGDAGREYLRAARASDPRTAIELKRRGVEQLLRAWCVAEGENAMRDLLASVGIAYPRTELRALLRLVVLQLWLAVRGSRPRMPKNIPEESLRQLEVLWSVATSLTMVDMARSRWATSLHRLRALRLGEPRHVAFAIAGDMLHSTLAARGTRARARARADEVAQKGEPEVRDFYAMFRAWATYLAGDFPKALQGCIASEQVYLRGQRGAAWQLDTMRHWALSSFWQLGRYREFAEGIDRHREDAVRRGDAYMGTLLRTGYNNAGWLLRDDPAAALRELDEVMRGDRLGYLWRHYDTIARTLAHLYEGKGELACRSWDAYTGMDRFVMFRFPFVRALGGFLQGGALALNGAQASSPAPLRRAARHRANRIERVDLPCARPLAEIIRAAIASQDGSRDAALSFLDSAARRFEELSMAGYAAACRWRTGELVGGGEGLALIDASERFFRDESVKNPERFMMMLVPGVVTRARK